MYIPQYFRIEDIDKVKGFIDAHGFALLVNQVGGRPWATHIPLLLEGDALTGHISRANKQWRAFKEDEEVLAVFSGPHAYVSSSWYDHENVPTWNYLAVHVYGKINIIEGEALKQKLGKLIEKYEAGVEGKVRLGSLSEKFVEREMRGIVGFNITITEVQASAKLSQNRDEANQRRIVKSLEQLDDANSTAIADLMKKLRE